MSEDISAQDELLAVARLESVLTPHFRRTFVGGPLLRKLETMHGRQLDPQELLKLIVHQQGAGLLAEPMRKFGSTETSIRKKLLESLRPEELQELFKSLRPNDDVPGRLGFLINKIARHKWHRGRSGARLITRALGMPEAYAGVAALAKREAQYEIEPLGQVPPLKPFQKGVLHALEDCLVDGAAAMVSSFTGTGKTRMGMEHCIDLLERGDGAGVLWIAQKTELLDQACDSIEQLWPVRAQSAGEPLTVFRYLEGERFQDADLPAHAFMVVATSQQVQARIGNDPFLDAAMERCVLTVIDEAHYSLAEGHQRIVEHYRLVRGADRARVLGLTATPGRSNLTGHDESMRLAALFGRQLVVPDVHHDGTALAWFQREGYLSKLNQEKVEAPDQIKQTAAKRKIKDFGQIEGFRDFTPEYLDVIGDDTARNRRIVEVLKLLHAAERHMLVFCCNIDQAKLLHSAMMLDGIDCGIVHHEIDRRDRRSVIRRFRRQEMRILLNVEVLTTGFDAPKIDTIVMCRPTLSRVLYEQMVGRGLRGPKMGGTAECEVVDFTGNFENFDQPQAWKAFWQDWKSGDLFGDSASTDGEGDWRVRRAAPETAETERSATADAAPALPGDESEGSSAEEAAPKKKRGLLAWLARD